MKEIDPIVGIDHETTIKGTIGIKIIDHKIIMKKKGPLVEINCTIETGTIPKNTKETIHTVEIGHEATTKMTIETTMKMIIGMIIGMTVEMTIRKPIEVTLEEKIVGILETRDINQA